MKQRYDFFHLRFPSPVAEVCSFFEKENGSFFDLPFLLPLNCKTVEYMYADEIKYEKAIYLKLNEMSQIVLQSLPKEKKFCWGVINISCEKGSKFLIWVNMNGLVKNFETFFNDKKDFRLIKGRSNEIFTLLWSA